MEPAAPGTEDEINLNLSSVLSKKENERERLLSLKIYFPSGKAENVFEFNYYNGSEQWYCNLCKCPIMGQVYHHEIGKRHTTNVKMAGNNKHVPSETEPIRVAPGEPVPPGFEDAERCAQIQERLDGFTIGPLIGLEYLFEIIECIGDVEPSYLCLLCEKRGDPRTVISHLASYKHINQYTQRHFVKCYRALSPYITKQYKRNWQATVHKIAEAIEHKFGRLKPHVVERETFESKRMYFQNLVASGPHFTENSGITFEELVDKEQLTKVSEDDNHHLKSLEEITKHTTQKADLEERGGKKRHSPSPPVVAKPKKPKPAAVTAGKRRSLSSVSSISSSDLSDFDPSQHALQKQTTSRGALQNETPLQRRSSYNRENLPVKRNRSPYKRYGRCSRSPPPIKSNRSLHPWERPNYIRSRNETGSEQKKERNNKLDEFKKLSAAIENDMDRILKQHEKNPEKHPQYNEEWRKFWNKRYKELQTEGKDAQTYDFKPEWIEFWNKRMNELHLVDVKAKKDALKKRLGVPEEPAPICFKITGKKRGGGKDDYRDSKPAPMASTPDQDPDVIVIEDKDEDTVSSKRSHSPWESETTFVKHTKNRSRERSRDKSRERRRISRERSREPIRRGRDRSRSRSRSRGRRSYERDKSYYEYSRKKMYYRESYRKSDLPEYIKPPKILRDATRHPVRSPEMINKESKVESEDEQDINIVAVLRLLTALEEKLGSLGPKVIDLLAQALAMEKAEANSSESLLDSEINCVLFETVKEKLKGQLLARLVDYNQEKAFKNAIKNIASLIHFASERQRKNEKEKPRVDPIQVPGVGTVDKAAIAKQIASALVMQGKTDVSQNELEQLINAVVGMAEASKMSNKPMTTAGFLEQLQNSNSKEIKVDFSKPLSKCDTVTNCMEGLSDSDLQTLLQNFKDLCTEEQHSLISYLKKLEAKEPERVERLRQFVNLDSGGNTTAAAATSEKNEENDRSSPFSNRAAGTNPAVGEIPFYSDLNKERPDESTSKLTLDSDDDEDYSYEDVFKAAKKNVKEKEEKERTSAPNFMFKTEDFDLSNSKSLISNIMGQIISGNSNNEPSTSATDLLGLGNSNIQRSDITLSSCLDNLTVNLSTVADAIKTVQKVDTSQRFGGQNIASITDSVQPSVSVGFSQRRGMQNPMNAGHEQHVRATTYSNHFETLESPNTHEMPFPNLNNNLHAASYPQQNPYINSNPQFLNQQFDSSMMEQPNRFPAYNNNVNSNMYNNRASRYDGNRW